MKHLAHWIVCLALLAGCRSQTQSRHVGHAPFSDVFLTSDPKFAGGTNLCLVIDSAERVQEWDRLVAARATAALVESSRFAGQFKLVIFFIRNNPRVQSGNVAAFTASQLEGIALLFDAGKEFNSQQSWVVRGLPKKQEDAESAPRELTQ